MDWLKFLKEKGFSFDVLFKHPLYPELCSFNNVGDPDFHNDTGQKAVTPLIISIQASGYTNALTQWLLQNGASPNLADSEGLTPLMHAVKKVCLRYIMYSSYN